MSAIFEPRCGAGNSLPRISRRDRRSRASSMNPRPVAESQSAMKRLETLGFWFNERAPSSYPRPQRLIGSWDSDVRTAVQTYLRAGSSLCSYAGRSYCRFDCGERNMGNRDLTDGTFAWPEGLVHYIDVHEVRLPEPFVQHVVSRRAVIAAFELPALTTGLLDDAPWLAWARAQGACLDLDGWEIPSWSAERRIADELASVDYDYIALCRGDTREVVLALHDRTLEVRQLRAGGDAPRRLHGWDAWPIAQTSSDRRPR